MIRSGCVPMVGMRRGMDMALPYVGATYPTVTGENTPKGGAFARIVAELPGLEIWSVYYDGSDLPSWNEEWFKPQYDHIRYYLVSMKTSDVNAVGSRLASMPEHLRGRIVVLMHHEPDQWRSVNDPRGDPSPDAWWTRQQLFLDMRETASWETWVKFAVCFTEDRWRTDRAFCDANWGNRVLGESRIDFVMFDCFNIGRSIVRQGPDIFGIPISYGRAFMDAHNRDEPCVMIREYGQVRPTDQPTDSTAVASGIAENWDYIAANATDVICGVVWYYNHNNTLADPTTVRRPQTLEVLQGMLVEAINNHEDEEEPTSEYDEGYEDGRASRDQEVADLQHQIVTLTEDRDNTQALLTAAEAAITQLQQDVEAAKAAGRVEAFGEVVNWAQDQT